MLGQKVKGPSIIGMRPGVGRLDGPGRTARRPGASSHLPQVVWKRKVAVESNSGSPIAEVLSSPVSYII